MEKGRPGSIQIKAFGRGPQDARSVCEYEPRDEFSTHQEGSADRSEHGTNRQFFKLEFLPHEVGIDDVSDRFMRERSRGIQRRDDGLFP